MITGHDFITLADRWSKTPEPQGDESLWRTAIGRAYYGAFNLAFQWLMDDIGIFFPRGNNKHQWVQIVLKQSGNSDAIRASGLLGDLHDYRKNADYVLKISDHGKQSLAQASLGLANTITQLLLQLGAGQKAQLKAEIQKYQRLVKQII